MNTIPYRRKKQGKTNYKTRIKLLQSGMPRLVVRKSNKHVILQIIQYSPKGDVVTHSSSTQELKKYGWKGATGNTSAAYLAGYLLGKKAGPITAVADIGMHTSIKGGGTYAALQGSKQAGMSLNINQKMLPEEQRIQGKNKTMFETTRKKIEAWKKQ